MVVLAVMYFGHLKIVMYCKVCSRLYRSKYTATPTHHAAV